VIEIDPVSVENLNTFCDAVYCLDLNDEDWISTFDGIEKFETIVVADVLEQLLYPLATLKLAKIWLSQQGRVIVSLPHIRHPAVMACLFNSNFSCLQISLLDRMHLRFFGIRNIQFLFDEAGLRIGKVSFIVISPSSTELICAMR
jgi:hypothetical protein